jgi:simple sugar transport system ATP-binding protein
MILDEPTAMLAPADADALFAGLKRLAGLGAAVVLVTHRLPEVLQHCERVTVLRAGRNVADAQVNDTNAAQLAEWIIGHSPSPPPERALRRSDEVALDVRDLCARGARGEQALKGVTLRLRRGEILGVAGVDGSGQRELIQSVLGLLRPSAGAQSLYGIDLAGLPAIERIRRGVRLIPEDRHSEGAIPQWSLAENAALGLQRLKPFARGPWVDAKAREGKAEEIAERFDTKHAGVHMPFVSLSGGNQQRFVVGRALCLDPKLILAFQPARGLDIEATRRLYEALRQECASGAAALIVSFDLDELLENCDRVVAMRSGRLFDPPSGLERDRSAIGALMVGAA